MVKNRLKQNNVMFLAIISVVNPFMKIKLSKREDN